MEKVYAAWKSYHVIPFDLRLFYRKNRGKKLKFPKNENMRYVRFTRQFEDATNEEVKQEHLSMIENFGIDFDGIKKELSKGINVGKSGGNLIMTKHHDGLFLGYDKEKDHRYLWKFYPDSKLDKRFASAEVATSYIGYMCNLGKYFPKIEYFVEFGLPCVKRRFYNGADFREEYEYRVESSTIAMLSEKGLTPSVLAALHWVFYDVLGDFDRENPGNLLKGSWGIKNSALLKIDSEAICPTYESMEQVLDYQTDSIISWSLAWREQQKANDLFEWYYNSSGNPIILLIRAMCSMEEAKQLVLDPAIVNQVLVNHHHISSILYTSGMFPRNVLQDKNTDIQRTIGLTIKQQLDGKPITFFNTITGKYDIEHDPDNLLDFSSIYYGEKIHN